MSKSKGNFITLRDAMDRFGTSETRFAVASAGEGLDDANFEVDVAKNASRRLVAWLDNAVATWHAAQGQKDRAPSGADRWFDSVLHRTLLEVDGHMARCEFRTALKVGFHDLARAWSWYLKRSGDAPLPSLATRYVSAQTRLLSVFVPHVAEEAWAAMGEPGSVIDAAFPEAMKERIDLEAERQEAYVDGVVEDVRNILRILQKEPKRVLLYTAPTWKQTADRLIAGFLEDLPPNSRVNPGEVIKILMAEPRLKAHARDIPKHVNLALKQGAGFLNQYRRAEAIDERAKLNDSKDYMARECGAPVTVFAADDPDKIDPANRAQGAVPGRPAVYVE